MIPRVGTCTKLAAKIQDTHRKGLELTLAGPNDWFDMEILQERAE